jgi:hypothetical protein
MIPLLQVLRELAAQGWDAPSTWDLAARARLSRPAVAAALCRAAAGGLVVRSHHPRSAEWGPRCSVWRLPCST